jgi:hypothetical protein
LIAHLDKERLNFAAGVTLYWTLVHMESTIQIDPESGKLRKSETVFAKDIIYSFVHSLVERSNIIITCYPCMTQLCTHHMSLETSKRFHVSPPPSETKDQ